MGGPRVDEVGVDLIGCDDHVVLAGQLHDPGQLVVGEDPTGRVVGMAQHEESDARVVGQQPFQVVEVVVPALGVTYQRPVDGSSPRGGPDLVEREVDGWRQEHAISGLREGLDHRPYALQYGHRWNDQLGVRCPAVPAGHPAGEGRTEAGHGVVVAEGTQPHQLGKALDHRRCWAQVMLSHVRRERRPVVVSPLVTAAGDLPGYVNMVEVVGADRHGRRW